MQIIPPKSRVHLLPYAHGVIGAISPALTAARLQTMKTRQLHFIKWYLKMGISDPTLEQLDVPQKVYTFVCYAVSHTFNETIFYCVIKSSTVNLYLTDAAELEIFKDCPDPTKNAPNQKSSYITNVVNEHHR